MTTQDTAPVADELQLTLTDMLVDAIGGVGFPSIAIGMAAEKEHVAYFTGNQHSEGWRWDTDKLRLMTEDKLQALYYNLKVAQHGG